MEGPHDQQSGGRAPIALVVKLSYDSVDAFAERFAVNVSRGGIFIRCREPKPLGTPLSLELKLLGGETVLRAQGVVRWHQAENAGARPATAAGMGVQFTALDEPSRALVDRMVALKERRGATPAPASPRPAPTPPPTLTPTSRPRAATPPPVLTPTPRPQTSTPPPVLTPTPRPQTSTPPPVLTPAPRPQTPTPPPVLTPTARPQAAATPPPALAPASAAPAQADLSQPHRAERLSDGPARLETGLPDRPEPIARPSRAIIGIDLGTTNSCAAIVKGGKPYVIPSREGYNTVPSIVALNARARIVVGHLAKAQLLANPRQTVWGAKRLVGRPYDSPVVQEIKSKFAYEIVEGPDGLAAVRLGSETLTLEQISALVLREVKEVAQNHLGAEVNRAVITVPAYYNERQRAAVRSAGALAGLQVERILNEPTAAALAYAFDRHLNQRVLVYDLGGGTFDASILELNDNVYEVVSTGGDTFLGGVDFDARIVDRLLSVWEERAGEPFSGDGVALSRLVDAAERAKCALSQRTELSINLPFLAMKDGEPLSLETTLSREEIVGLVEPLVDRTLAVCQEVLDAKGLRPADLDEVLLVGGQSRMPLVHDKVAAFFGKPPSCAVHPDEAVAIGAALLAQSLESPEGVVLIDVLPMSIGLGLPGGRVKTIMERNTPLPARKQYGLATTRDGQTEFELVVLQGESDRADQCEYLGTLRLEGLPPGPRGMVRIAITFELGAECLLTVTARELNSGRQVQAVMSTREGPEAAQRRLEQGIAKGATGTFAVPGATPPPVADGQPAPAPEQPEQGEGAGGLLRRLFRREAR
ncbi:TIGR02266 family protein [Anaeromyxobacter oryzisoli]|uniref:TIGR02266 family protein n=1 Tax=Anaeromyxobacter oryzisoli TaxID=2925408 RepID=UPI001F56AE9F|nr:TIGR02266 family protein [Anaeromyxobacter sp. SG63]